MKAINVFGFEGLYCVTDEGRVFSLKTGREMVASPGHKGYLQVHLRKGGKSYCKRLNRVVWGSFNGGCDDNLVIDHINGDVRDNRLYAAGCREVHVRIACPPLVYPCRFINFSRSKNEYDLITRRFIRGREGVDADLRKYTDPGGEPYREMVEYIREKLNLTSLAFQTIDDLVQAIRLPRDRLCTYCWTGEDVSMPGSCAAGCGGCPHACPANGRKA